MNKSLLFQALVLMSALFLASCSGLEATSVEVTREVRETVLVTELVFVTATPPPATDTPVPTPTPAFQKWTTSDAVDAIQDAGLEFENPRPMVPDDYGLAPMKAAEAIRFLLPSLCADCGGRLYSFTSQEDLETMEKYYVELGEASAMFFSWVFTHENLLIQINGDLPEARAVQYREVLQAMR